MAISRIKANTFLFIIKRRPTLWRNRRSQWNKLTSHNSAFVWCTNTPFKVVYVVSRKSRTNRKHGPWKKALPPILTFSAFPPIVFLTQVTNDGATEHDGMWRCQPIWAPQRANMLMVKMEIMAMVIMLKLLTTVGDDDDDCDHAHHHDDCHEMMLTTMLIVMKKWCSPRWAPLPGWRPAPRAPAPPPSGRRCS